jgi:outer membrane protein assembly factor BamA
VGSVAFRVNFGLAVPYGDNQVLPYEKYYFAGGSNSIRAWQPRRLGPGSYRPLNEEGTAIDYSFEQQGELLLETSIEFRRNLLGFIDGAIFIDAGNVWSLQSNDSRENASFSFSRFYKEIAVGTGIGMRFNFQFLIMRLDWGIKVYDPAKNEGDRFVFDKDFRTGQFANQQLGVLNIGIGYPF